jgi:hypothetical protein
MLDKIANPLFSPIQMIIGIPEKPNYTIGTASSKYSRKTLFGKSDCNFLANRFPSSAGHVANYFIKSADRFRRWRMSKRNRVYDNWF